MFAKITQLWEKMVFLRNKIYQKKDEKKFYFNRIITLFSVER